MINIFAMRAGGHNLKFDFRKRGGRHYRARPVVEYIKI